MNLFISKQRTGKNIKSLFSGILMLAFAVYQVAMPLTVAYATAPVDVKICHKTDSTENPWNALTINENAQSAHTEHHNDFLFNGSGEDVFDDAWCLNHAPTPTIAPPQEITVSATKVVCDTEESLPNWGDGTGGPEGGISSTTATDWVNQSNGRCHLQSDWGFAWSYPGYGDVGSNTLGVGNAGWHAFDTTTNASGVATVQVPINDQTLFGSDNLLWVREQPQAGYIPFSDDGDGSDGWNDVSAEFYCHQNVANYDNYDYIAKNPHAVQPFENGDIYHCVGFNVKVPEPLQCNPDQNLIQNGDFEVPAVPNGGFSIVKDIVEDPASVLQWLVAWAIPSPGGGPLGLEIQNNVAGSPEAVVGGNQFAELDGYHPSTIWQDIPTIPGKEYSLTFKYSPRPGQSAAENSLQVKKDGVVLGADISTDGSANGDTVWQPITRTFVATGSTTKVELFDNGTNNPGDNGGYGPYVDNVSLTCMGDPAPSCDETASQTIVSDTTTQVDEGNAVALSFIHPAWTANIPGATWIWATNPVVTIPETDVTKVFTKTFSIVGTPTGGTLDIAADNNYSVKVNGTSVPVTFDQNNFQSGTQDTYDVLSLLVSGTNTLEITVTNWGVGQSTNPAENPGGLLYKLSLTNDECVIPPTQVQTSTVTMCKTDDAQKPAGLSGWQLMLEGASAGSVDVLPNGSDFKILGVPVGDYILKATGMYTYRGTTDAEYSDAAYSKRAPADSVYGGPYVPWVRENDFPVPYTGWLGIIYNNAFTNWGSIFNPSHIYALGTTMGALGDLSFKIIDDQYNDNSGKITVDALHGYTGVTGEDGCVTFDNVPYGSYNADEILKDGWTKVSGTGEVTVNDPTETFTIVNHDTSVPAEPTFSSHTTIVKNADLADEPSEIPTNWFFYNDETDVVDNTLGSFVNGPSVALAGVGSAQMSVTGTQRRNIATYQFKDVKLADITSLQFSTYSQLAGDGALGLSERAPYLNFNVDFNNSDTWQKRLVFVPGSNGVVSPDTWQTWDAINGGTALWTYSGATWPTTADAGTTPKTWAQILALYPNAETRSTDSWFGFRVGEPYADGFTGNVDKFVIGIKTGLNTHTETYDFEPTPPAVCSDQEDNDEDGLTDSADPACHTDGNAHNTQSYDGNISSENNGDNVKQCSDNKDNDSDEVLDMQDPGCHTDGNANNSESYDPSDNDETDVATAPQARTSGGGGGSVLLFSTPAPQVLGASTTCGIYLEDFLKRGWKNNKEQVKKLQTFLNDYLNLKPKLPVNGIFGAQTYKAVVKFQEGETDLVLKPWVGVTLKDAKKGTGFVYKTTVTRINNIMCPELNLPIPAATLD